MDCEEELKLNILTAPTTYLQDYKRHHGFHRTTSVNPDYSTNKFEEPKPKLVPPKLIDQETFVPLRKELPMGLMIYPNEITGTNPLRNIGCTILPEYERSEEIMRTRPRVTCSPQFSLDDVPDADMRKLLVDYTYTTHAKKAEQELLSMIKMEQRSVPNTVLENDRFLPKNTKHYFSVSFHPMTSLQRKITPELNQRAEEWTNQQLVGIASRDELFWENKDVKCGACFNPLLNLVKKETKDKIRQLVEKNQLRIPHDKKYPSYDGFLPELAVGVDLGKKDLPCAHPLLSTSQVIAKRKK